MGKKTKALLLALCAVALVVTTVFSTMAYLTSNDSVTNTFTVGKVAITLDEAKANPDGTLVPNADRVQANSYKLLPGHSYAKDPTVHVAADSENCYLYVKVENGINTIEDTANPIAAQMETNGWKLLAGTNVYYKEAAVAGGTNHVVFSSFKIAGGVKNDVLKTYATAKVTITAYAIQADGFTDAADAWSKANGQF